MAYSKQSPDPLRVLMVSQRLCIGGMERMILGLTLSLRDRGLCHPVVFAYDQDPNTQRNSLIPVLQDAGVECVVFKKKPAFSSEVVRRLLRTIREHRIEVVHCHCLGGLLYASIAKMLLGGRLRIIQTQHSFIHLQTKRRYNLYERVFTQFADAVTVVSEDTRQTYIKLGFPERKIRLIRNGVSFAGESVLRRDQRLGKREGVIGNAKEGGSDLRRLRGEVWLLYLARLHPAKGQDHAMKLWGELPDEVRKRAVLIFVGPEVSTEELSRLRAIHESLPDRDRVVFVGPTEQPEAWLSASDVFISCSGFEGMPLGPLEAVGAGLPVLLSAIPGHEFLEALTTQFSLGDWRTGAQQLASLVKQVVDDPCLYERLWEGSRSIVSRFSIDTMADSYYRIYAQAAGRKLPPAALGEADPGYFPRQRRKSKLHL